MKNHARNITSSGAASFLICTILALISLAINHLFQFTNAISFIGTIWISNIIAVTTIVIISYGIAILTFKRGLNPENFVIPIETSLATIVTSIALLVALLLIG
jgi:cation transporter-like permease